MPPKLKCEGCKAPGKPGRLPPGWKRVAERAYCKDCFRKRYVVRAVTLPVGVPVGMEWAALNEKLAECFRLSTSLANWCVHQLFRLDTPGVAETPEAIRKWYGYGSAKECYPDFDAWAGAKQGLNIVTRAVQRKYVQSRFDLMVRFRQDGLTYRYPYPYPVDADGWATGEADGGFPVVTVQLPGLGPVGLRLKRRADFGRQLAMVRQLHQGAALKGEAALYRNGKGDLLVKLVGWFPRPEPGERVHACLLRTDPNAFLVAEIDGRSPWILNCDHLKRWQAAHRAYRQRLAEDAKREKRMDRRQRQHLNKSRRLRCDKNQDRVNTAADQLAAQVVRFCARQKVACLVYDDSHREYLPDGFPWHRFKERLSYKLDGAGVVLVSKDNIPIGDFGSWVANAKSLWAMALSGKRLVAAKRRPRGRSHPAVSTTSAT